MTIFYSMQKDIVQVKFKIVIPTNKWLAKFNKQFPELSFDILSKYLLDNDTGSTLLKIEGASLKQFLEELKNEPNESSYQILYSDLDFLILNVKTKDPWILKALIKTDLLLIYPIKVKNCKLNINAITPREKADIFLSNLEKKRIKFKIKSIGKYHREDLLTNRQKEVLKTAYKAGFYKIPRKISLSVLSKQFSISPSALSELLRRIHGRLAAFYISQ